MSKSKSCVEKGAWVPAPTNLVFTPSGSGAMTFHMVGCSGDPDHAKPGGAVAQGMTSQIADPGTGSAVAPSFFYHLGDIAYTESGSSMTGDLWNTQFYNQYKDYAADQVPVPIFSIAGNHDGNTNKTAETSEIFHYMQNILGPVGAVAPDNTADPARTELGQPSIYWRLDTPLAYIIGVYANVSNGGLLDDPTVYKGIGNANTLPQGNGPQYLWLVDQLTYCKTQNSSGTPRAILLAVHYPPYNGATDFGQRGDPTLGGDGAGYPGVQPLGMILQSAYDAAAQIPDAVFSAHAHLYQRLTVTYNDPSTGQPIQQVPHLVAGCGGHTPLELMDAPCTGKAPGNIPALPYNLFTQGTPPPGLTAPENATVMVEAYADGSNPDVQPYGFLRVTLTPGTLLCEFFTVPSGTPVVTDSVTLDLATHLIT